MSKTPDFEWDDAKDRENQRKHGVPFALAQLAFVDSHRIIAKDVDHSTKDEERFYCFGIVAEAVMTVRFVYRKQKIRIFGAGYWRKGRNIYEKENKIH